MMKGVPPLELSVAEWLKLIIKQIISKQEKKQIPKKAFMQKQ